MRHVYKILLVISVLVALFLGFYERATEEKNRAIKNNQGVQDEFAWYNTRTIQIKDKSYLMYIADTDELRSLGLSGKSDLPQGRGMMFTFPQTGVYPFWMKQMRFPLDILWVREGKIVEVWEKASVPLEGDIPSYTPHEAADIVLEFPAGFVKENALTVGDVIR